MKDANETANRLITAYMDDSPKEVFDQILEECHPLWKSDAKKKARQQLREWSYSRRRFAWCTVKLPSKKTS